MQRHPNLKESLTGYKIVTAFNVYNRLNLLLSLWKQAKSVSESTRKSARERIRTFVNYGICKCAFSDVGSHPLSLKLFLSRKKTMEDKAEDIHLRNTLLICTYALYFTFMFLGYCFQKCVYFCPVMNIHIQDILQNSHQTVL